ncbi:oxidoreductase, FAD-binding protein [Lentisphaera araneosa HTCC2155]|uniref:Oxidoreductase, FAD-binding protein n=1 Tax=Lentisphaera araneosa HTCC2155 TaxID=313628 RepID=A6DT69_9BACT|nr:pyridoxamine 5'-phosphate oxidase family protein [Lentisphaera araneosa]EDM25142.1 oxidoreductase, FAD-binding protein [Lentisphaera araneosa HTCC2155]
MNSPFHEGEISLQKSLGIDQRMDTFGRKVIRDFMPDQHRKFYCELPYIFLGHQDPQGDLWASVLSSQTNFISSPNENELAIKNLIHEEDPLSKSIEQGLVDVGLLGINLENRRRNRLSARISSANKDQLQIRVKQSFGNCPKFISKRRLLSNKNHSPQEKSTQSNFFTSSMRKLIKQADTFFVASSSGTHNDQKSSGADVSHRGGDPGFIQIENDTTLCIPDYSGNGHFNTLGNFLINPRAGLLFIDFENATLISMTGKAELFLDTPKEKHFPGAERLWRFYLKQAICIPNALPFKWQKI